MTNGQIRVLILLVILIVLEIAANKNVNTYFKNVGSNLIYGVGESGGGKAKA